MERNYDTRMLGKYGTKSGGIVFRKESDAEMRDGDEVVLASDLSHKIRGPAAPGDRAYAPAPPPRGTAADPFRDVKAPQGGDKE